MGIASDRSLMLYEQMQKQKKYWNEVMNDYKKKYYFCSFDQKKEAIEEVKFKNYELEETIEKSIIKQSKSNDFSLFAILVSGIFITIHKYCNDDKIGLAIPSYKSNVNKYLILQTALSNKMLLKDFIIQVGEGMKKTFLNQNYPFTKEWDENIQPSVTCNYITGEYLFESSELPLRELNFQFIRDHEHIKFGIYYNINLFDEKKIDIIQKYFHNVLYAIVKSAESKIDSVRLVRQEEREEIFKLTRGEMIKMHKDSIVEYLNANVEKQPDQTILCDLYRSITFHELWEESNQVINCIMKIGVEKGDRVAIYLKHGVDYVVAIVGIVRMGAVYIPLEESMPVNRINYILENSQAKCMLVSDEYDLNKIEKQHMCIRQSDVKKCVRTLGKKLVEVQEKDGVYIIYTSGTTGLPKGVQINHGSVVNLIEGFYHSIYLKLSQKDCFGMLSSFCFDASIKGIFTSLMLGIRLYIFSREQRLDKDEMLRVARKENITLLDGTPMDLRMMLYCKQSHLGDISHLIIGGESMYRDVVKKFYEKFEGDYQIINVYGPTESTVEATYFSVVREQIDDYEEVVPIGYAFPNKSIYILDKGMELVPEGSIGELYISGVGNMDGYLRNKELTEKSMYPDIVDEKLSMYKTGDMGYLNDNGQIVCIGRVDKQVKIDGYRVEIGEIEEVLRKHDKLKDIVVTVEEMQEQKKLVCYYVLHSDMEEIEDKEWISFLESYLPSYMIPKKFYKIKEIPLTTNGKIDYELLKSLDSKQTMNCVSPRDVVEKKILDCLREILGYEMIGIDHNIFQAGINSISALRLISSLEQFHIRASLLDLFTHQTIREFYDYIKKDSHKIQDMQEAKVFLSREFDGIFEWKEFEYAKKQYIMLYCTEGIDIDELNVFIYQNFHPELIPHYIMYFSDEQEQEKLINTSCTAIIKNQCSDMVFGWNCCAKAVMGQEVEVSYPASVVQNMMIEFGFTHSGTNIVIERPLELKKFQRAFQQVMKKHPLLRSEIKIQNGRYIVMQHKVAENALLPVIDFSQIPLVQKDEVIMQSINNFYYETMKVDQMLPYRACILKISNKQYILALPAHHCIFDGMSGEVIKKDLLEAYNGIEIDDVLYYENYIRKMNKIAQSFLKKDLEQSLNLSVFDTFFEDKDFVESSLSTCQFEVSYSKEKQSPWMLALNLMKNIVSNIFMDNEIPFYTLHYGRRYKDMDFLNMVGPFIDLIPCVLKREDTTEKIDYMIRENIKKMEAMNLNFLLWKNQSEEEQRILQKPLIVFNYQGEVEEESYLIRTKLNHTSIEDESEKMPQMKGVYIEILNTGSRMHVMIESIYKNASYEELVDQKLLMNQGREICSII